MGKVKTKATNNTRTRDKDPQSKKTTHPEGDTLKHTGERAVARNSNTMHSMHAQKQQPGYTQRRPNDPEKKK